MARSRPPDSPSLFDLPLEPSASEGTDLVDFEPAGGAREAGLDSLGPQPSSAPEVEPGEPAVMLPRDTVPEDTVLEDTVPEETVPEEAAALPRQLELSAASLAEDVEDEQLLAEEFAAEGGEEEEEEGSVVERILGGVADLTLHAAVALILLAGTAMAGVRPSWTKLFPLGLFLLVFSFLYGAVALAFWGATPGMAWRRLSTRGSDGEALSFPQAFRRWLGGLLTLLLAGLPLLPLLWGARALSDRLSGSVTVRQRY